MCRHCSIRSLVVIHEKQFQEWAERAETLISSVDAPGERVCSACLTSSLIAMSSPRYEEAHPDWQDSAVSSCTEPSDFVSDVLS